MAAVVGTSEVIGAAVRAGVGFDVVLGTGVGVGAELGTGVGAVLRTGVGVGAVPHKKEPASRTLTIYPSSYPLRSSPEMTLFPSYTVVPCPPSFLVMC